MRYLAAITMLILALAITHPVAAQSFKPNVADAYDAYNQRDYATALKHFRPLAEKGNRWAQLNLGRMYYNGKGVPKDDKQAFKWYRLSAKQGLVSAQRQLGWMYRDGEGVLQDLVMA